MAGTVKAYAAMALVVLLASLACTGGYRPGSDWERTEFSKADRNVHPDDVRQNLARHASTVLAWSGIILEANVEELEDQTLATFLVQHHYFDWLDDSSPQSEHYYLSKRGEGLFRTTWSFRQGFSTDEVRKITNAAKMVIVYGRATEVIDAIVVIDASYVRSIKNDRFRADWDYGRVTVK